MEPGEVNNDTVHPEVRAHVNSLVSALGGYDLEDGTYRLGDDALECLRDLKRWIRFYDEKTNRMDVARSLADANLVGGDLLHIMALWSDNCVDADDATTAAGPANKNMSSSRFKARLALACIEMMVPLTWPIERDRATMTVNHHRHIPVLQLAQVGYKRAIINFDGAHILRTTVRAALPAMATPIADRTARDHGVIKLMLFLLRNVAMIAPPAGVKYDGDESQISRSAVIDAFSFQDVLLTLLTIASNMGDDFRTEDTAVMEILFHLVKRVDPAKLFMQEQALSQAKADELTAALGKEAAMVRAYNKNAPTRHSRFGTMIWVKRESGKLSTVTGQEALLDPAARERKMDSSKTFRAPKHRARKEEMEPIHLGPPVSLNARASQQLRSFVEEFLDSGFNPLFGHVTASIEREAPHVLAYHRPQFFYLVAWFLEAERLRKKAKPNSKHVLQPTRDEDEIGTYNLVAEVLDQKMFIALNRALTRAFNDKEWQELAAVMRCLTQILITVQEMSESSNEEDQEIAENTLSRLFYQEATHDAIAGIARSYKDQGFEYLDSATELVHTFLRILEAYSKQNVDLQVRSRKQKRRRQKKRKAATLADPAHGEGGTGEAGAAGPADDDDEDSAADEATAARTTRERKFDFTRFSGRFADQGVVNTFVAFTKYYRDLDSAQLKRAHRFFYRIAFKQELGVMLCRLDIIHMLYNMIKGPEPLPRNDKMLAATFKEWEELVKQILRKCVRKLQERPALFVELLFSKTSSTAMYLEYGHERQTLSSRGTGNPRPGAELEFRGLVDEDRQVAIAAGALLDKNEADHISWVKAQLDGAEKERRAWEAMEKAMPSVEAQQESAAEGAGAAGATEQASEGTASANDAASRKDMMPITVRADNAARRKAMFKNPHLRLLMKLVGMERLATILDETPDSSWVFPATRTADELKHSLDLIKQAEFSPPTFDDGKSAADQLRRKSAARRRVRGEDGEDGGGEGGLAGFLDDDDDDENADGDDDDLDGFLFAKGGPTARQATDENGLPIKRKKRLSRKKSEHAEGEAQSEDEEEDDAEKAGRAHARRRKELEKLRKIKSAMYVTLSDDETDEERDREFFEQERRRQQAKNSTFGLVSWAAETGGKGKKDQDENSAVEGDVGEERTEWEMLLDMDSDDEDKENEPAQGEGEGGDKRQKKGKKATKATKASRTKKPPRSRKRKSPVVAPAEDNDDEAEDDGEASAPQLLPSRKKRKFAAPRKATTTSALLDDDSSENSDGMSEGDSNANEKAEAHTAVDDAPLSSTLGHAVSLDRHKATEPRAAHDSDEDEDEDDVPIAAAVKTWGKARAGFIIDSSDEE